MKYPKITKALKNSQQNNSETVTNENDKEIPKEINISPEERQKIYWQSKINFNSIIIEYQKIINLLDNTPNQPAKFRTKNWVEIHDDSHGTYNTNSQIKFKTSMLKSSFCVYTDAYILVKGTITVEAQAGNNPKINDKKVLFKICVLFTDWISEITNTQID